MPKVKIKPNVRVRDTDFLGINVGQKVDEIIMIDDGTKMDLTQFRLLMKYFNDGMIFTQDRTTDPITAIFKETIDEKGETVIILERP